MNEENLSALLDGECSPSELEQVLHALEKNPALRARFGRMVLAHELRQGVKVRKADPGFADRVRAALPARPDPVAANDESAKVVALRPQPAFSWRPAAGLAAAAAVGAAAVLVLQPEPAPTAITIPAPVAAVDPDPAEAALAQRVSQLDDQRQQQLRNYLMSYSQSRAQQGMGTLGYARYAAHTDGEPQDNKQAEDAKR